jgi:hypothetical protein
MISNAGYIVLQLWITTDIQDYMGYFPGNGLYLTSLEIMGTAVHAKKEN